MTARGPAVSFALKGDGLAAAFESGLLHLHDAEAKITSEVALPKGALGALPYAEGWLVRMPNATHLTPVGGGGEKKPVRGKAALFADGGSDIAAFAVAVDGIAIARAESLELWTHAGKPRWSVPSGPWVATAMIPGHVLALGEDGALAFAASRDGSTVGTLRLASTEPPSEWRLAVIDPTKVVLALGEFLVWVDVASKKTLRRVRCKEKVTALAADAEFVAAGLEGGEIQVFRAGSGEPGALLAAHDGGVRLLALGKAALFSGGAKGGVKATPRLELDVAPAKTAPVTALASRGDLVALGDHAGTVQILKNGLPLVTRPLGEEILSVSLTRSDSLVVASPRLVLVLPKPWDKPRPLALRTKATAFAADEDYAFAGTDSGAVDVYDLAESTHVTTYALSDGDVTALARLPGKLLVVGTGALDGRVFVVDVTEAKVKSRLEPHDEAFGVTCLASDPRGRLVASGADDGSIALIDPAKGKVLARLRVRETPVSLAFDDAGRRIACVFADGTAALVHLGPRGATMEEIQLSGASRTAWGASAVFGFVDGRVQRLSVKANGEAAARPS
ncbi:MAG: hypothetical protein JST00_43765 [Deltaproteobacteria bacterium]|nr:hypothetical protein [Deltaproteobacteria bacterium]